MSHDSLMTVLIEKPPAASFGRTMHEIRTWLDQQKIQPVEFRPIARNGGFSFELRFRNEEEAYQFQQNFA